MKTAQREQFRYFTRLQTRWGDVDQIGHINNAKYFTYDEQARISYFEERLKAAGQGPSIILARIACDFLVQVHHPSDIDYGMRITRMGRSSLYTEGALFVGDVCHARTEGVVVWFDYAGQKTGPIPEAVRQVIRDYEVVPPVEA